MTPSIDNRLASMMTALREVILPALATNGFAAEQAGLILAHLGIIREQVDHSIRFEQLQLAALVAAATGLVAQVAGGPRTVQAGKVLEGALGENAGCLGPGGARALTERISSALSDLVEAGSADGTPAFQSHLADVLLAHVEHKALQDRAWFAGAGFEFNATDFPSIPDLISIMEAEADAA